MFKNPESRERILHTAVHYFISLHIPTSEANKDDVKLAVKKSNLKQKEYDIRLNDIAPKTVL